MVKPAPSPRYHTINARIAIAEKFKWPYENWMQDWPLEVADKIDLALCVEEYSGLVEDDEKFLLMRAMLYALDESNEKDFELHSLRITEFLQSDFDLHQYTIFYWALYQDYTDVADGFKITPLMRTLWNSKIS